MTARGRNYKNQDWDPMRDDYNNSSYEPQYADDNTSEGVNLDHRRLYITNIPVCLNDEGLHTAFAKYGTITEAFVSKDPTKRYALVSFETSGEAKLAMMKMNKTEPLRLHLAIAHKPKTKGDKGRGSTNSGRDRHSYRDRDDSVSVGSKTRHSRKDDMIDGDEEMTNGFPAEEDLSLTDALDANWSLEMESLRLEHLKLREEQLLCKQRMMLIKQKESKPMNQNSSSTRCLLPDGRIIVRNSDRASESRDGEAAYAAGAGDSPMPALQREFCRQCVRCGSPAESYCSRCGVTPYCSAVCQRRDWNDRHSSVCHNLARLSSQPKPAIDMSNLPRAPPLRRPHSPAYQNSSNHVDKESSRHDDSVQERHNKNYRQGDKNIANTNNRNSNRNSGKFVKKFNGRQNSRDDADSNQNVSQQNQQKENFTNKRNASPKPSPKRAIPPTESEVVPPKTDIVPTKSEVVPPKKEAVPPKQVQKPQSHTQDVKEDSKPRSSRVQMMEAFKAKVNNQAKEKVVVPKTYVIEHLNIGDSVIMSVDNLASSCRTAQLGYVCLTMHEKYEADYQKLCEDYVVDCEADTALYKPSPGDSLSYFQPEDGGWYRARCVSPNAIALLDACKVVSLKPSDKCKVLSEKYRDIPEFCCLLDSNDVEVGASVKCTLLSKTTKGFKVSIFAVESGAEIGSGEVMRWVPEVEYPKTASAAPPRVPSPTRPALQSGAKVTVCDVQENRVCVLPADENVQAAFYAIMEDVALYGESASPLTVPPAAGACVVCRYSDGLHYRALLQRTNVAADKYKIQYLEYGNVEVTKLASLYPCPKQHDANTVPPLSSIILLDIPTPLTPAAEKYLEGLKEQTCVVTLAEGVTSSPSGSVANLTPEESKDDVTKVLRDLCKPEWKKFQEQGGDVLQLPRIMYEDLELQELDCNATELEVLDTSELAEGCLSVCNVDNKHAKYVFTTLQERMAEYCNSELGREPYLPIETEMCIVQLPSSSTWQRGVMVQQAGGAGGAELTVLCVDTGRVAAVSVASVRKMLAEFTAALPAVANQLHLLHPPHPERALAALHRHAHRLRVHQLHRPRAAEPLYRAAAPDLEV